VGRRAASMSTPLDSSRPPAAAVTGSARRLSSSTLRSRYFNTLSAHAAAAAVTTAPDRDVMPHDVIVHQRQAGGRWSHDEDTDVVAGAVPSPSLQSVTLSLSVCLSVCLSFFKGRISFLLTHHI